MTQATVHRTMPPPQPDDSEDIVSALETAEMLWRRGDPDEALRWLRRAVETAGDVGNDVRAAALASAAADLKPAPPAPAPAAASRPPPSAERPKASASEAEPAAFDDVVLDDMVLDGGRMTLPGVISAAPSAATATPSAATATDAQTRPFPRSAVRVYVLGQNQQGERLDVRVLQAGEQPPAGAELALLVPLDKDADLVS